ncbi:hypothetical protein KEJ32_02050 [Candidatus Bathyarchaeota archaeon]|nr:hypothetical protein [Candidatus Bathyarchaeota archaeon]
MIGSVTGIEVKLLPTWQITHLHVSLTEETTRELGYKKPFLGSVEVLIPISIVKAVGDLISLNKHCRTQRYSGVHQKIKI